VKPEDEARRLLLLLRERPDAVRVDGGEDDDARVEAPAVQRVARRRLDEQRDVRARVELVEEDEDLLGRWGGALGSGR